MFARARDAANAAAAGQRALADHDWPEGGQVRVRMGMHTGETLDSGERYHGLGIHRAARIMAAAHGGQVLLSRATSSVLEDDDLRGIELRDLGEHSLKDLDRPEGIHQLLIDGLEADFPPLRLSETDVLFAGREHELADAARSTRIVRSARRRPLAVGAVGALVVAAVAVALVAVGRGGGEGQILSRVSGDSVGVVDAATGKIVADVPGVPGAAGVAAGEGAIWVANSERATVSRVDRESRTVRQTIAVGNGPSGIAAGGGAVWVVNSLDGTVSQINAQTNQVVDTIAVGNGPLAIALAGSSVWVTNGDDQTVSQIDARSGRRLKLIRTGVAGAGLAVEHGTAWLSDPTGSSVSRLDLRSGQITGTVSVGSGPTAIASGGGSIWVANSLDGTVSRIEPRRAIVTATIPVGSAPSGIATDADAVWVSDEVGGTLVQIDARTARVLRRLKVGARPQGLALADGAVWLAAQAAGSSHRGGTLFLVGGSGLDSVDPALAYDATALGLRALVGDGLVGFKRVGGRDGNTLVPDLAESLPRPTDDGRTYTFQLRPKIRYSNGALVKAADVRWTFERLFKLGSPVAGFYSKIVGAAACLKVPKSCSLGRGIVGDESGRITFHLSAPDSEFLYKLAIPFAQLVPNGNGAGSANRSPPGTGPYLIARYRPRDELVLTRNPAFRVWSKQAQPDGYPDRIVMRFEPFSVQAAKGWVSAVESGRSDWTAEVIPSLVHEVRTRYPAQLHATPSTETDFMLLNDRLPPFNDVAARRAVNYAVNRARLVALVNGFSTPTCQVLPPNFPAYEPYCPYTLDPQKGVWSAPDMRTARRLVAESGTDGMRVEVVDGNKAEGGYFVRLLDRLGYRARLRYIPFPHAYDVIFGPSAATTVQAAGSQFGADYPAASNMFAPFVCGGGNLFCNHAVDDGIARALALQGRSRASASALWTQLDRKLVDEAASVPLINPYSADFVSRRVGNYQHHPVFGILFDQLWVR